MKKKLLDHLLSDFIQSFHINEELNLESEDPKTKLFKEIQEARKEWLAAWHYFQYVTDADLIEHAIFAMDAAERKYMYLLKRAKKEGLSRDITIPELDLGEG